MVLPQLFNLRLLPYCHKLNIKGSDSTGTLQAGVPNITGNFAAYAWSQNGSGAFYPNGQSGSVRPDGDGKHCNFGFNASRSSSIYGASTTVQPPTITLIPQIKF